jgi:hypothetical protein
MELDVQLPGLALKLVDIGMPDLSFSHSNLWVSVCLLSIIILQIVYIGLHLEIVGGQRNFRKDWVPSLKNAHYLSSNRHLWRQNEYIQAL